MPEAVAVRGHVTSAPVNSQVDFEVISIGVVLREGRSENVEGRVVTMCISPIKNAEKENCIINGDGVLADNGRIPDIVYEEKGVSVVLRTSL